MRVVGSSRFKVAPVSAPNRLREVAEAATLECSMTSPRRCG